MSAPSTSLPVAGRRSFLLVLHAAEGLLQFVLAELLPPPTKRKPTPPRQALPTAAQPPSAVAPSFVPICAEEWHRPSQGAELLTPALHDAFARLGIRAADVNRIACVRGPGSFTGIRLTLATAAGLARATGAQQAGIDYLPLLAQNAAAGLGPLLDEMPGARLWVITHARGNLVHMQGFTPATIPAGDISICSPSDAANIINRYHAPSNASPSPAGAPGRAVLLGSGLTRNRDTFAAAFGLPAGEGVPPKTDDDAAPPANIHAAHFTPSAINAGSPPLLLPPCFDAPSAAVLTAAAARLTYACEDISPLYVRPCDAEDNLDRIAASLRLDPADARRKLAEITGNH